MNIFHIDKQELKVYAVVHRYIFFMENGKSILDVENVKVKVRKNNHIPVINVL